MALHEYLMENDNESFRLELKTDIDVIEKQARWAGIEPGMRVADIGCGPGKTTYHLNRLVQPGGSVLGIDNSPERIDYAKTHFADEGIQYQCLDIYASFEGLGLFDFIWVRFFLEFHRSKSSIIVERLSQILKPGGILCLIDLDSNCLNHFGITKRLEKSLDSIMRTLEQNADFDPYAGIKLYSYLYDAGMEDIKVKLDAHHLIYGSLNDTDKYNWTKKVEVAAKTSGYRFEEYPDGYEGFFREFKSVFSHPRRFTYTPMISCHGRKTE